MDNRTPLYGRQKELNARFVSFGGWELPVSYTDIIQEHHQVRKAAGLFDVSHMGEIRITGKGSEAFLNELVTNDIKNMKDYQAIYSPMCQEDGGTVDDIIIYRFHAEKYLLVVNASNTKKDYQWIISHAPGDVTIENLSECFIQLAVQGPNAQTIIQSCLGNDAILPRFFRFVETELSGMKILLSRTGYTGEDGFEIYMDLNIPRANPELLWDVLLEKGKPQGLMPVGLGARDTLRFEACLPLYGHELSETISPLEAGLDRFVNLSKSTFIGKAALESQRINGISKKLYGFEMLEKGIPRSGYAVFQKGLKIGSVTSGSFCPSLNRYLGMAMLDTALFDQEMPFEIDIREKPYRARLVDMPFYQKQYKK